MTTDATSFQVHGATPSEVVPAPPQRVYAGYIILNGHREQVDFQASATASKEELASAFVDALAQVAVIDYLAIGDI